MEINPASVLAPSVAGKIAATVIYHPVASRIKVDPAIVVAPHVAGHRAVGDVHISFRRAEIERTEIGINGLGIEISWLNDAVGV